MMASEEQFQGDVLDAVAAAHKAGKTPEDMAAYLRSVIIALTTPALWVARRNPLARKGMH